MIYYLDCIVTLRPDGRRKNTLSELLFALSVRTIKCNIHYTNLKVFV